MKWVRLLIRLTLVSALLALAASNSRASDYKDIVLDPSYEHDKWGTQPRDIVKEFLSFTTSFDSNDDNDGDGLPEAWGVPEWVSYEIKRYPNPPKSGPSGPSMWVGSDLWE